MFFLVLPGLVKRFFWNPLVRALWVPVQLPCLVWISSGCGSAVVRRSSRSLRGFGASLPVAWSHPTLARYKASYSVVLQQVILLFPAALLQVILIVTYCREDQANPHTEIVQYLSSSIRAQVDTVGLSVIHIVILV